MQTAEDIRARLNEIAEDERYHYPPANVIINAPLALIQVGMDAAAEALAWVLEEKPPKKRKRSGGGR